MQAKLVQEERSTTSCERNNNDDKWRLCGIRMTDCGCSFGVVHEQVMDAAHEADDMA